MSFGGAPRCTTCGSAVYHAEQVMGPARKIYHKTCLKCENCGKRLDPGGLVEHDSLPYCSRCHTQLFGTRDLRRANVNPSSPVKTPSRPLLPPSPKPIALPRPLPPPTEYYTPPNLNPTPTPSTPTYRERESVAPGSPDITRPNFRADRPITVPYSGRVEALDDRGLLRRGDSPRSKVGERPMAGEEMCWGCGGRVYAAEQVFAVGHKWVAPPLHISPYSTKLAFIYAILMRETKMKREELGADRWADRWHKACLRCTSCKTTLDPSKVSDRDGVPYCRNCYAKEHGPGGIMGKR